MTTTLRPAEPVAEQTPRGIWQQLARASQPEVRGDLWRALERRVGDLPPSSAAIWQQARTRVDPQAYRPHAVADVAADLVTDQDEQFYVLRSPRGTYLRLTAREHSIWRQMDGTRTVADLATQAFFAHRALLPVGELVAALRREGFLADQPVGVYRALGAALLRGTAGGIGRRIWQTLSGAMVTLPHVDAFFSGLYRYGGRLLFTRLFLAIWVAVVAVGITLMLRFFAVENSQNSVLTLGGSVPLGIAALALLLLLSIVLHECAHALAAKHFGRTIPRGGIILYFGMPTPFVDTSDVWRSPRNARVLVSAVGPMADVFIGSLAVIAAALLGGTAPDAASLALKLAIVSFASGLFNLNPLLEFDGYFILVDLLRLPNLRQRSIAFLNGPFWQKLRARAVFTTHERIFAGYGAATSVYALLSIALAVVFWNRQLVTPLLGLLGGSWYEQVLGVVLLLLTVGPVLAVLALTGWEAAQLGVAWLLARNYGRRPRLLAAVSALSALALALLAYSTEAGLYSWLGVVIADLLWALALGAIVLCLPDYRRAALYPALTLMTITTGCSAAAGLVRALAPDTWIWIALDGAAAVTLLLAAFTTLLDVDLRLAPLHEQLLVVVMMMLSFAIGSLALFSAFAARTVSAPLLLLAAAPAFFGALALALLLQHLFSMRGSRLRWAWLLLWGGVLARVIGYVIDLQRPTPAFDVLAAGLWAAAWLTHYASIRTPVADETRWQHQPSISEGERLTRAFQFCYATCYRRLRTVYGERRARAFDDRMDVLAATADWDVTLDRDRARVGAGLRQRPVAEQGARFAEVLRYTVSEIEVLAGAAFARRTMQAAYDLLPWPERETAGRLCFPDTPWARELSSSFGDARAGRLRLLRQNDLFLTADDAALDAVLAQIEERRLAAGALLLRGGDHPDGLWIVDVGEIGALRGNQIIDELHRGAVIGQHELLHDTPVTLDYQATVSTTVLFVPAHTIRALHAATSPNDIDRIAALRTLEQVPLLAGVPRDLLRRLAGTAEARSYQARELIVRQGVPSGWLFVIRSGRAAVLIREPDTAAARRVAILGPQEFFGEMEIIRGVPPAATIVALDDLLVFAVPHSAFAGLLTSPGQDLARGMRQIVSGRLVTLRDGG